MATSVNPVTAGASRSSRRSGRRRTSKTSAAATLTPAMALEIFQSAVLEAQRAGVDIAWAPMEGDVILFRLQGVRLCPACLILRPAAEMTEAGVCRSCAPAAGEPPAREEASTASAGDDQREDPSRPEPA
jgi:hypothetical protein